MTAYGSLLKNYLSATGRASVWVPGQAPLRIGDYGRYKHGLFERVGNVFDDYGVHFELTLPNQAEHVSIDIGQVTQKIYTFSGGAKVPIDEIIPGTTATGDVEVEYTFHDSLACKYVADRVIYTEIKDMRRFATELSMKIDQHERQNPWQFHNYRIIIGLQKAENMFFRMSRTSGSSVAVVGDVGVMSEFVGGEITGDVRVARTNGHFYEAQAFSQLTPIGMQLGCFTIKKQNNGLHQFWHWNHSSGVNPKFSAEAHIGDPTFLFREDTVPHPDSLLLPSLDVRSTDNGLTTPVPVR